VPVEGVLVAVLIALVVSTGAIYGAEQVEINEQQRPFVSTLDQPRSLADRSLVRGDGQFFKMLAEDPTLSRPEVLRMSDPEFAYRAQRPLLGWLGWMGSLGRSTGTAWVLYGWTIVGCVGMVAAVALLGHQLGCEVKGFLTGATVLLPGAVTVLVTTGPEPLFEPAGDQPAAIASLAEGIERGDRYQTLLGITGSGKSATIAGPSSRSRSPRWSSPRTSRWPPSWPTSSGSSSRTTAVEYFVSYYDYYQPEAYIASSDTYIEKDSSVNDEIDRLRHAATSPLLTRRDVIVVASVSCIYGLGSPEEYSKNCCHRRWGRSTTSGRCCASWSTCSTTATT
jgi:hypothetical protein